jgi:6-phosphogluconolactonase
MTEGEHVYPDAGAAAAACALHIAGLLERAGRPASLALSGGSTPGLLFDALAGAGIGWDGVHIFWADERSVSPDDPASNYRLAEEHLLRPAGIAPGQVHRIRGELPPEEAAKLYSAELRDWPAFDVLHLGMGADGHTASLFPGSPLLEDRGNIAAAVPGRHRVTLLPGILLAARHTVFLAAGRDKAEALRDVLRDPCDPHRRPACLFRDRAHWFVDLAAASLLG